MRVKGIMIALMIVMSGVVKTSGNYYNKQALYIYNFLRHVKWPEQNSGDTFVIGVYGSNQVYGFLIDATQNRKVGTKTIKVQKINSFSDAANCELVYVTSKESDAIAPLKKSIGNRACLIVSEKEGLISQGSTIEFVLEDNKLRFRINETLAREQNLVLSKAFIDMGI